MRKMSGTVVLLFAFSIFFFSGLLHAAVVEEIGPDGALILEDGKKLSLAGVQMDEEGISVLRVLAHKQDVRSEILQTVRDDRGGECAYVYLNTKSIKVPFKTSAVTGQKEVMLNEFLISLGAAKVNEAQEFSKKSMFLKAQEEAKKKGEGVWSYVES